MLKIKCEKVNVNKEVLEFLGINDDVEVKEYVVDYKGKMLDGFRIIEDDREVFLVVNENYEVIEEFIK